MSSTVSQSGTSHSHVDRKALKRPDGFFVMIKKLFDSLGGHIYGLMFVVGTIVLISAIGVFLMTQREASQEAARNALFQAQKSLEADYKTVAAQLAPKETASPNAKATADAKKKEAEGIQAVLYKKFDVDAMMAGSVAKLKAVSEQHSGTRAGFEGTLEIGNLYLSHGEPLKAAPWFEKALSMASTTFDKSAASSAIGHAHEDAGKFAEAAKAYDSALKSADPAFKGELLLSLARSYELMKDTAKAESTYDQIISQMPATEYAKAAETQKALLE